MKSIGSLLDFHLQVNTKGKQAMIKAWPGRVVLNSGGRIRYNASSLPVEAKYAGKSVRVTFTDDKMDEHAQLGHQTANGYAPSLQVDAQKQHPIGVYDGGLVVLGDVAIPDTRETVSGWPWGDHSTQLLQALAAAAHQWWSTFDSDNPTTAPTNADVINWLMKNHGVSRRLASSMATILRADGLRTGPRR